jgi:SAM-dependent methyltransferase
MVHPGWGVEIGSIPDVRSASAPEHAVSLIYQEAVMSGLSVTGGSAGVQSDLWGVRAREWCAMEAQMRPLYEAVFERVGIGHGTELLDAGCGAGLATQLAAQRGAVVSGFDATPALLAIAAERVPSGEFAAGDLESLPYGDDRFDAVVGFNSFQYAASPRAALEQARRVARAGASVVIATWAAPERCEAAAYIAALGPLLPPPPPGAPGPFALSAPGALEGLATEAGLTPLDAAEVSCPWTFPDLESALTAMLAAGPAIKAIRCAGEAATRDAVAVAIEPFRRPSGEYAIGSAFRYLVTKA